MEFSHITQNLIRTLTRGLKNATIIYLVIQIWTKLTLPILEPYINEQFIDPFQSHSILYNFIWSLIVAPLLYVLIFQAVFTRILIKILKNHFPVKLNELGIRSLASIIIACLLLAPFYNLPERLLVVFPVGYTISGLYVNYYFSEGPTQAFLLTWFTLTFMLLAAFIRYYLIP